MGASGAYQWQCPAPPDELLRTAAGGRNTALFDAVRKGAYRLPRGSGNGDVRRRWDALWVDFAVQANRMFPEPLGEREVSKTAASVSRWTWANPEFGRGGDGGRRGPGGAVQAGAVERCGAPAAGKAQERADRRAAPAGRPGPAGHRPDCRGLAQHGLENGAGRPAGSGVFHEPITAPGGEWFGWGGNSWEMTETVKFPPPQKSNESRHTQPLQQPETVNPAEKQHENRAIGPAPPATPIVENSEGGVDNPPSSWEEAIREGARRRADESRRRAERERRSWMDRGPPED